MRQILRRWVGDAGLDNAGATDQLETVELERVEELLPRLFEWMANPARRLPTGQSPAELAAANKGDLAAFEEHADRRVGAYSHRIAGSAFVLLTRGSLDRLGECPSCGWLFVDTSKNGRRRWCSMATCGGRDKARRHYRVRAGTQTPG